MPPLVPIPTCLYPLCNCEQVFKEEEEAVKVELHEGCGRIKLYWTMALADFRTLKGMVEFKEAGGGEENLHLCTCTVMQYCYNGWWS